MQTKVPEPGRIILIRKPPGSIYLVRVETQKDINAEWGSVDMVGTLDGPYLAADGSTYVKEANDRFPYVPAHRYGCLSIIGAMLELNPDGSIQDYYADDIETDVHDAQWCYFESSEWFAFPEPMTRNARSPEAFEDASHA